MVCLILFALNPVHSSKRLYHPRNRGLMADYVRRNLPLRSAALRTLYDKLVANIHTTPASAPIPNPQPDPAPASPLVRTPCSFPGSDTEPGADSSKTDHQHFPDLLPPLVIESDTDPFAGPLSPASSSNSLDVDMSDQDSGSPRLSPEIDLDTRDSLSPCPLPEIDFDARDSLSPCHLPEIDFDARDSLSPQPLPEADDGALDIDMALNPNARDSVSPRFLTPEADNGTLDIDMPLGLDICNSDVDVNNRGSTSPRPGTPLDQGHVDKNTDHGTGIEHESPLAIHDGEVGSVLGAAEFELEAIVDFMQTEVFPNLLTV